VLFRSYDRSIVQMKLAQNSPRLAVLFEKSGAAGSCDCWLWFLDRLGSKDEYRPIARDVATCGLSDEGKWLATVNDRHIVTLYDAATGDPVGNRLPHSTAINFLGFDPSGQTLICGCRDSTVRLWDIRTRLPISFPFYVDRPVVWAALSPDQRDLVAVNDVYTVFHWRLPLDSSADPTRRAELVTQQRVSASGQPALLGADEWKTLFGPPSSTP
jgi:WD40 repeat protein